MDSVFRFLKPHLVVLSFAVVIALLLRIWTIRRSDGRIKAFAESGTRNRIASAPSAGRRIVCAAFLAAGLLFLVTAAMRPQGDPRQIETVAKGRDLVFMIDVSRSMLAQDLPPNRLQRAVLAIRELVPRLRGDRVGLVVFAGNAALKCPLTLDYEFFIAVLERISPKDVSQGGTNIGDALRIVADRVLDRQSGSYQDIILISDGEDHDSFALEAAGELGERGTRIHAIGLGSTEGARIPDPEQPGRYIMYEGQTVHSKLNEELLKGIASMTSGGSYLPARTGNLDLAQLYESVIVTEEEQTMVSGMKLQWREWFQAPLLLGLLLLGLEAAVRGSRNV